MFRLRDVHKNQLHETSNITQFSQFSLIPRQLGLSMNVNLNKSKSKDLLRDSSNKSLWSTIFVFSVVHTSQIQSNNQINVAYLIEVELFDTV